MHQAETAYSANTEMILHPAQKMMILLRGVEVVLELKHGR